MPLPGTPYKNQEPAAIDEITQQQLVSLTARGKVYGKWKGQIQVGEQLTRLQVLKGESD
jgi:hypothetical protein